jgi:glucosamine-6-phosphate deaminase
MRKLISYLLVVSMLVGSYPADSFSLANTTQDTRVAHSDLDTLQVPLQLGNVVDHFKGNNGKTVIHIQDAHCYYSCQKSIEGLVRYLNREYGVDLALMEGGAGDYDLSVMTNIRDTDIRAKVADHFVREGRINGAELFAIEEPGKLTLKGLEDPDLYLDDLKVYRENLVHEQRIDDILSALCGRLADLRDRIYNPELRAFAVIAGKYENKEQEIDAYLGFLLAEALRLSVDTGRYKGIEKLTRFIEAERTVDLKKAEKERAELVKALNTRLSVPEKAALLENVSRHAKGEMSLTDFYFYIFRKAASAGLDAGLLYPDLKVYSEYVSAYESIDEVELFDEIKDLSGKVAMKLFRTDKEKELYDLSEKAGVLKGLFSISLSRAAFNGFKKERGSYRSARFTDLINEQAERCGLRPLSAEDVGGFDGYVDNMAKFYEVSFSRDRAFIGNIDERSEGRNVLAVVTGGFHAEGLKTLLREKGYSYISVIPKLEKGDASPYVQLLSSGVSRTEMEISVALSALAFYSPFTDLGIKAARVCSSGVCRTVNSFELAVMLEEALTRDPDGVFRAQVPGGEVVICPEGKAGSGAENVKNITVNGARYVRYVIRGAGKTGEMKDAPPHVDVFDVNIPGTKKRHQIWIDKEIVENIKKLPRGMSIRIFGRTAMNAIMGPSGGLMEKRHKELTSDIDIVAMVKPEGYTPYEMRDAFPGYEIGISPVEELPELCLNNFTARKVVIKCTVRPDGGIDVGIDGLGDIKGYDKKKIPEYIDDAISRRLVFEGKREMTTTEALHALSLLSRDGFTAAPATEQAVRKRFNADWDVRRPFVNDSGREKEYSALTKLFKWNSSGMRTIFEMIENYGVYKNRLKVSLWKWAGDHFLYALTEPEEFSGLLGEALFSEEEPHMITLDIMELIMTEDFYKTGKRNASRLVGLFPDKKIRIDGMLAELRRQRDLGNGKELNVQFLRQAADRMIFDAEEIYLSGGSVGLVQFRRFINDLTKNADPRRPAYRRLVEELEEVRDICQAQCDDPGNHLEREKEELGAVIRIMDEQLEKLSATDSGVAEPGGALKYIGTEREDVAAGTKVNAAANPSYKGIIVDAAEFAELIKKGGMFADKKLSAISLEDGKELGTDWSEDFDYVIEQGEPHEVITDNTPFGIPLGPCIAVIIQNTRTKRTYAVHSDGEKLENVEEMIRAASSDPEIAGHPEDVRVVVAGGMIVPLESGADVKATLKMARETMRDRERILSLVSGLGRVYPIFSGQLGVGVDVDFDTGTSVCYPKLNFDYDASPETIDKFIGRLEAMTAERDTAGIVSALRGEDPEIVKTAGGKPDSFILTAVIAGEEIGRVEYNVTKPDTGGGTIEISLLKAYYPEEGISENLMMGLLEEAGKNNIRNIVLGCESAETEFHKKFALRSDLGISVSARAGRPDGFREVRYAVPPAGGIDLRIVGQTDFGTYSAACVGSKIAELQRDPAKQVVMVLATGQTMIGFLNELARYEGIDWKRVQAFHLDEYKGLPTDNPYSFANYLYRNLFSRVPIPAENIHYVDGARADFEKYKKTIRDLGGADIVMLGCGMDGHLAFNEPPKYSSFRSRMQEVELEASTIEANRPDYPDIDKNPYAYTMGMADIFRGKHIFFLARGSKKADIVRSSLEGPVTEDVPASILQKHRNVTVILDEGAASGLAKKDTRGADARLEADFDRIMEGADEFRIAHARQVNTSFRKFIQGGEGFEFLYGSISNPVAREKTPDRERYFALLNEARDIYEKLSEREKYALLLGTILHDVGYVKTAKAWEHWKAGSEAVGAILKDYGVDDPGLIANIRDIVAEHSKIADLGLDRLPGDLRRMPPGLRAQVLIITLMDTAGKLERRPPHRPDNILSTQFLGELLDIYRDIDTMTDREFLGFRLRSAGMSRAFQTSRPGLELSATEESRLQSMADSDAVFTRIWSTNIRNNVFPLFLVLRNRSEGDKKIEDLFKLQLLIAYVSDLYLASGRIAPETILTLDMTGEDFTDPAFERVLKGLDGFFAMGREDITEEKVRAELEKSSWSNAFGLRLKFGGDRVFIDTEAGKDTGGVKRMDPGYVASAGGEMARILNSASLMSRPCTIGMVVRAKPGDNIDLLLERRFAAEMEILGKRLGKKLQVNKGIIEYDVDKIRYVAYVDDGTESPGNLARMEEFKARLKAQGNPKERTFAWILSNDGRKDEKAYIKSVNEVANLVGLDGEYIPVSWQMLVGPLFANLLDSKARPGTNESERINAIVDGIIGSLSAMTGRDRLEFEALENDLRALPLDELAKRFNGRFLVFYLPPIVPVSDVAEEYHKADASVRIAA